MKTLKILVVLGTAIILFGSCQQKSSNDKVSNKNDSLSTKANNEYAIMMVNCVYYDLIRIYYGNNKSEDYPITKETNEKGIIRLLKTNDLVNALNYMSKKGWELKNSYSIDNEGTQSFIFRKVN